MATCTSTLDRASAAYVATRDALIYAASLERLRADSVHIAATYLYDVMVTMSSKGNSRTYFNKMIRSFIIFIA